MTAPQPKPGVLDVAPYVPGAPAAARAPVPVYKLSANESALGPSPAAMDAYATAQGALHEYPDGGATALREALAEAHDLDAARIVCGAGSDELLQLLARAYAGPGDAVVQTAHGFLVYAIAAQACGADVRVAPERALTADVDAILEAVDETTRIVFLANPNNPTGTYLPADDLARLHAGLRDDVLLVVDAAYAEYLDAPDYETGAALVDAADNVVMTRTFSKIYGLGGLRLGWAYCPAAVADALNRIRGPFNVSAPAIAAGVAAVGDVDFVARNRDHNRRERARLAQALGALGIDATPSAANFILAHFASPEAAGATRAWLAERGVAVREMAAYGLPSSLRLSIGSTAANARLIDLLTERFS
ncbi:MAG: histidinol-phosphate transaminase [Pseudomonadota bacterium]